jgi:hydrogenase nickel incorporation protein HypA/HybF
MHEASLVRDLVAKVDELAAAEGARRVTGVCVRLGALAHFSPDHVRRHFEQAAKDTIAEGASLSFENAGDIHDPEAQGLVLRSIEVER